MASEPYKAFTKPLAQLGRKKGGPLVLGPPPGQHYVLPTCKFKDGSGIQLDGQKVLAMPGKGQVFVVYNRVRAIHAVARRIADLVPEARLGVAHGQMEEDALEQVMVAFMDGKIDVLITTTIIESGIDIPNANTLVVFRADAFGLADLYQLRGRVGRFDRHAYAYLVVPKRTVLTEDAMKRLDAMTQHTALGSGFRVAMEDLKIRGAGNLLGVEQSGHISAVGFDLYCRLLREAVGRLKEQQAG